MEVAEYHVDIAPDRDDGLVIRMLSRASDKSLKARKRISKEIENAGNNNLYKCGQNPS